MAPDNINGAARTAILSAINDRLGLRIAAPRDLLEREADRVVYGRSTVDQAVDLIRSYYNLPPLVLPVPLQQIRWGDDHVNFRVTFSDGFVLTYQAIVEHGTGAEMHCGVAACYICGLLPYHFRLEVMDRLRVRSAYQALRVQDERNRAQIDLMREMLELGGPRPPASVPNVAVTVQNLRSPRWNFPAPSHPDRRWLFDNLNDDRLDAASYLYPAAAPPAYVAQLDETTRAAIFEAFGTSSIPSKQKADDVPVIQLNGKRKIVLE